MDNNIIHEIDNYLNQIIANAEHIVDNKEVSEYASKIKDAAYSIEALITDTCIKKTLIKVNGNSTDFTNIIGLKVMIVDDVIENINIMRNIFTNFSCEIVSASSGEEALETFSNGFTPDIVCMDIIMPGIDGATTTKELKIMGCEAYFIAISALKNQSKDIVSIFDCWLPKPFTIEHITAALSAYKHSDEILNEIIHKLNSEIPTQTKEELLRLAEDGAYSKLKKLIVTLEDSKSKEFLNESLKRIDFNSIIKSIVSP